MKSALRILTIVTQCGFDNLHVFLQFDITNSARWKFCRALSPSACASLALTASIHQLLRHQSQVARLGYLSKTRLQSRIIKNWLSPWPPRQIKTDKCVNSQESRQSPHSVKSRLVFIFPGPTTTADLSTWSGQSKELQSAWGTASHAPDAAGARNVV